MTQVELDARVREQKAAAKEAKLKYRGIAYISHATKLVVLPAEAFDALASRLEQPGHYDPRVARVLSRKAPWE